MRFRDINMRLKLMMGFSLVILIPLIVITTFSMKSVTDGIEESMHEQVEDALDVAISVYQNQIVERAKNEAVNIAQMSEAQLAIQNEDKVALIQFTDIKRTQVEALLLEVADENGRLLARSFETNESSPILRDSSVEPTIYLTSFLTRNSDEVDPFVKRGMKYSVDSSVKRVQIEGKPDDILVRGLSQVRTYEDPFGVVIVGYLLNDEFSRNVAKITNTFVTVYSHDKPIAFSSDKIVTRNTAPPEITEVVLEQGKNIIATQRLGADSGSYSVGYTPIRDDSNQVVGMLSVAVSRAQIEQIQAASKKYLLISSLIALLFAVGMGQLIARQITNPINKLARGAKSVAEGNLDTKIDIDSKDEIGTFANIFNNMTQSLLEGKKREEKNVLDTIAALSKALEARDSYSEGHSQRVAEYTKMLAKMIGLPEEEQELLYNSGLLHDVGKIGIRDAVLLKDGRLTEEEYNIIKMHPVYGYEIAKNIDFLKPMLPMIRHHHEKVDGTGYPDRIKQDDIPLGARLMALADVYDAVTTDRPYRKGMSQERALSIFKKDAGTHFDAELVDAFLKGVEEGTIVDIRNKHKRPVRMVKSIQEEFHDVEPDEEELEPNIPAGASS